ncbi:MAG: molybdopterin biosynthesis protein [Treponema sp.]|jgi:putative molybdopterin biosynthesis protein|nr:molybdopterin biosynthesis protein [Treponema sp.]
MAKRNLYLSNVPAEEALFKFLEAVIGSQNKNCCENIPSTEALDRITSEAIYARCCSPLYNAAAMDGIAVISKVTAGACETTPVSLLKDRDFVVVDTGASVKPPFDAVIMAEDLQEVDENTVLIRQAAAAWQHMRPIGEDIVTGEMILTGRYRIRPVDIGVLLSAGVAKISVLQKPKVAIFPTGNEIIDPGDFTNSEETPKEGKIIESNSRMLEAMVRQDGGAGKCFNVIPDDPALLENAVKNALSQYDMILIIAGSSAGTEDYTAVVLKKLGKIIVHGAAIKPGKPVILAVADGKPVIGIPGYPVSAFIAYRNFVSPVLARLAGKKEAELPVAEAIIAKRLVSSLKHREYVRVKVGNVDGRLVASPLARGAGAAMSLVRCDGICIIEQNCEGIEAGETAAIELLRPLHEIECALVSTGSHDLILDVIADIMAYKGFSAGTPGVSFQSTHVGSMAGLMALKRGECHIAPIHLLDEDTGSYNIPFLKRLFPGPLNDSFRSTPMCLIKGVGRVQGLIVKKGNPHNLCTLEDLLNCRFINRQRGSGTRLFLDYKLKQAGLDPKNICGYEREAVTHMAVAAAVINGDADAGMGIYSAAAALNLDFIPLGSEEYDFAIPPKFLDLPQLQMFLEIFKSTSFRRRIEELGGYTLERSGEIVKI